MHFDNPIFIGSLRTFCQRRETTILIGDYGNGVTTIEKIELFNGESRVAPLTEIGNLLMGLTKDTFEISIERLIKGN